MKEPSARRNVFAFYEHAVQTPVEHVALFSRIFAEIRGRRPVSLREDFCGTFLLATTWVPSGTVRVTPRCIANSAAGAPGTWRKSELRRERPYGRRRMHVTRIRWRRRPRVGMAGAGVIVVSLAGCAASRPVLYPNPYFQQVGQVQADADIADCEARAKEYVKSGGTAGKAAAAGGTAAAVGAAAGAAGGAAWGGHAGQGAAAGAAGGATAGILRTLLTRSEPSDVHKSFVSQCLADRGYRVIGWQ